jgi:CheY-like chemotaxis protein
MLQAALERDGFEVVSVMNVTEALSHIANEKFDVLVSDLHMPHAGDGFTVVSAMRHTLCLVKTSCTRKINDFQRACSQVLR